MLVKNRGDVLMRILNEYTKGDGKLAYVELEVDGRVKILSAEHYRERYVIKSCPLPVSNEISANINLSLSPEKEHAG